MDSLGEDSKIVIHTSRLKFYPVMLFAIVMGFSGITILYQKAFEVLKISQDISFVLLIIDSFIFVIIILLYLTKLIKYFEEVKKEFNHPVRLNFFAAISISFLLLSITYHNLSYLLSISFFYVGLILQTFLTFYTISFWINNNMEVQHSNPAWFIPIVGNIIVPVAGSTYLDNEILTYYFSVGLFFWIILTSILINRIIFHNQMAVKFVPTLFIFIAPPAVGFIAYIKMFNQFDFFANILYSLALFFTFLLIFMYKNFLNLKFFISWWAFTFPLSAIGIASILAYKKSQILIYSYLAYFFIFLSSVVILLVTVKTIKHILKKEICIQE